MSTSAISPISSNDYGSTSATASQQSVFNNLVNQLEQSISGGDLTTAQTLLNAVEALSPSSASGNDPLGSFLTSIGQALSDGSVSEAESALAIYQGATASSSTATSGTTATSGKSATSIASGLVLSQIQLNLVDSLFGGGSTSTDSSSTSQNSVLDILNAAYGSDGSGSSDGSNSSSISPGSGSGSATSTINSSTPYDTLVSAIQNSLNAGSGTGEVDLSYLNSSGNFVSTSA